MKKVVLITGTSSGLGLSLAIQAAKQDYRVYATMRNLHKKDLLEKSAQKAGVSLQIRQLDVQDQESVQTCVGALIDREGQIDYLINNAGAGFVRSLEQATEQEVKWVMDVNFMGTVRTIQATLPSMRKAGKGHIINISSVGGLVGQPFNEVYCAAKFAVEGLTESMATYIEPHFGVRFTVVEPGGIQSDFALNVMNQLQQSGGMTDDAYLPLLKRYIDGAKNRPRAGIYQSAEDVAQVILECMQNPNPPLRLRTSPWANEFCNLKTQADPTGLQQKQRVTDLFLS